jgi:hypothetical protein
VVSHVAAPESSPTSLLSAAGMSAQPFLFADSTWLHVRDANPTALNLFHRHYSYKPRTDGRRPLQFVGPGEKMVLLTENADALFVWRKFISDNGQRGVNCAVFRNESSSRASDLVKEAMAAAWERWPGERLYTYVNRAKIRPTRQPGRCFIKAGWRQCGITARNKLVILECEPV